MMPLFSYGFRPFFLLAAGYAFFIIPIWWLVLGGVVRPPGGDPILWHSESMVFGFISAGVAGFVLTSVPNWTKTAPLRGPRLAALAALWSAARILNFMDPDALPTAILDLAFIPGLIWFGTWPIVRTRMTRNYVLILILLAYWCGDVLYRSGFTVGREAEIIGIRTGMVAIVCLLTLIGGRVIPSFTNSAYQREEQSDSVRCWPWIERIVLPATAAGLGLWLIAPEHPATTALVLAAAMLHAIRLSGWRPWKTLTTPLLWILHAAYTWLVLGLALIAASNATEVLPVSAAIHALTAGAIANMLLGVMSRAALGHTGRPLTAPRPVVVAYFLLNIAALLRVLASPIGDEWMIPMMSGAAAAWTGAFGLFIWIYGPMLTSPRVDGRAG